MSVAAGIVAVMVGTGSAWACTAAAGVWTEPNRADVGVQVTVEGRKFVPDGSVDVSLESPAASAPLAKRFSMNGDDFSIRVEVPNLPAGMYTLVAIGRDSKGHQAGRAVAAFEVLPSRTQVTGVDSGGGSQEAQPAPAPTEAPAQPAPTEAAPAQPVATSSTRSAPASTDEGGQRRNGPGPRGPARSSGAGSGEPAGSPPAATPGPVTPAPAAQQPVATTATPPANTAPSARATAGDLWSGFSGTTRRGLNGHSIVERSAPDWQGSNLGLGLGLLSIGLAGLGSGAVVLGARRQRAHHARVGAGRTRP